MQGHLQYSLAVFLARLDNQAFHENQRRTNAGNRLRNTQEASTDRSRQREGRRPSPSDPSQSPWTDSQIRLFLLEWEGVEQEVGHPGKKIHKKTRLLCQRLYQRGLRKTWHSCFNLLLTLQNLYRSLCDERPRAEPLFSPYAEALYRILGPRPQESYFPACYQLPPEYPQAPTEMNFPEYQLWCYGFSPPSGEFPGNPSPMFPSESLTGFCRESWEVSFPQDFPPVFLETQQPPSSPSDEDQGPH